MIYSFGDCVLDTQRAALHRAGQVRPLRRKVLQVLTYLLAHPDRLISKRELCEQVWPQQFISAAALESTIKAVRQTIGDSGRQQRLIQTVYGQGYCFIAPVRALTSTDETAMAVAPPSSPPLLFSRPQHFVGRDAALAQLTQWFTAVRQGQRQVGFIAGEPGIGKTALVEAFVAQVSATEDSWIGHGQCVDHYGVGEPYLPLLEALGRLGRSPVGAPLVALLRQHAPSWLMHLPALLAPEDTERLAHTASGVTPARMLRELAETLEVLTTRRPLVLILEDIHWSDSTTLAWVAYMARRRGPARLLILGTYRPVEIMVQGHPLRPLLAELRPLPQCSELVLDPLSAPTVAAYVTKRFAVTALPPALPQLFYQYSSGHPLFLVALVDELVRQGFLSIAGKLGENPRDFAVLNAAIPASLQQYIEQHFERLSAADQALLEAASVAGSTFTAAAVAAATAQAPETIEGRCTALARQEQFVQAMGYETWPDGTVTACYQFRHALYQEVVSARVSAGHRVRLHQQIGLRKEAGYGASAPTIATELARHFARGQDPHRASLYLQHAADTATQRQAYQEVLQHCQEALALLATLPETPERARQELGLYLTLGPALIATRGYMAPEVEQTYARARTLCHQVGDTRQGFLAVRGLWMFYETRGPLSRARQLGDELLAVAQQAHDTALQLEAHRALGDTFYYLGELVLARTHLAQAAALYDPHEHRAHTFLYGDNPKVFCLAYVALPLLLLGHPTPARESLQAALTLAQELSHLYSLTITHYYAALLYQLCRDGPAAYGQAEALITLATEHGFPVWLAGGTILRGWALAAQGQGQEGLAQIRQGLAARRATGEEMPRPYYLALLAEAYGTVGQPETGLHVLTEALAAVHHTGERVYEAELYRFRGDLLLVQADTRTEGRGQRSVWTEAEACFQRALAVARRQQAQWWELRAAMSLSRLWQRQGKHTAARELLAGSYGWFTAGFDTADLKEARALLDQMA